MKRFIFAVALAAGLTLGARAETDARALSVIKDIQQGVDNMNRIERLKVGTSVDLPAASLPAAALNSTNAGVVTAMGAARGLKVEYGTCTGTAIKVFTTAFSATPAVFITPGADVGTGRVFAASVATNGFTASGFGSTISASWFAVGLAP